MNGMNVKRVGLSLWLGCLVAVGGCATSTTPEISTSVVRQPETRDAKARLMAMSRKLAQTQRFSVKILMNYDVVQESGVKIVFRERREVLLDRSRGLRAYGLESDGDRRALYYDGKAITLFDASENIYANIPFSAGLDKAIRYAVSSLDIRVPLAWMLLTSLPQDLERLTTDLSYVELDVLDEPATDHIAGSTKNVDYQFWIGPDDLPRRLVLTYRKEPGQPEFRAEFGDWDLSPRVSNNAFVFTPPPGAEQVPFLIPRKESVPMGKMPESKERAKKKVIQDDDEF